MDLWWVGNSGQNWHSGNAQTDKKFGHHDLKKAMNFPAVYEDTNSEMKIEDYLSTYTVRTWLKQTYMISTTSTASDCSAPSVMPLKKRAIVAFVAITWYKWSFKLTVLSGLP